MAQDQILMDTPPGEWTQLTNGDATGEVTFLVLGCPHYVRCTANGTTPIEKHGLPYPAGTGEQKKLLSDLVSMLGPVRLWVKPVGGQPGQAYIDYA
jgi:hypothetical protein